MPMSLWVASRPSAVRAVEVSTASIAGAAIEATLDEAVRHARCGDRDAFGVLVQHFYDDAWRLARRRTACAEDADECCQEAMLSAWCSIGRFEGDAEAFAAWLMRIVTNRCADHWRRKSCRPRTTPFEFSGCDDGHEWVPADAEPSPERHAERAEMRRHVDQLIDELPEPFSRTLRMHHDGCSYLEIADSLDLPVGTVRSRLNRARAHMRALVDDRPELHLTASPRSLRWPRRLLPLRR